MTEEKKSHIEKLFKYVDTRSKDVSKELFQSTQDNVDMKTDLIYPEDVLISILRFNDRYLQSAGLDLLYDDFVNNLMRVRFSLDRKSRQEFVQTNTRPLHNLQFPGEFQSIKEARK